MSELIEATKKGLKTVADFFEITKAGEAHHSFTESPKPIKANVYEEEVFIGGERRELDTRGAEWERITRQREERSNFFGGEYSFQKGIFKPVPPMERRRR